MIPGPVFIPAPQNWDGGISRLNLFWFLTNVPEGYIFQPATSCTPAGWVRPRGTPTQTPGK